MTTMPTYLPNVLDALAHQIVAEYDLAFAALAPERVEPIQLPPTAPRIRVERCIEEDVHGQMRYAAGWLCIWGDGGSDWCPHLTWRNALDCALSRARARALGILGRW